MQLNRRRSVNATSSRVRVAVRIRPPEYKNARDGTHPSCVVPCSQAATAVEFQHDGVTKTYTYDHVFGCDATQEEVYSASLQPLMGQFLDGFNVTVMAYGQTGSGKTYTMGNKTNVINVTPTTSPCRDRPSMIPTPSINAGQPVPAYRGAAEDGLIPRFLSDLFTNLKKEPSVRTIHVTFVEIYCDTLRDLLNGGAERNLCIREDPHNAWVENVHSLQVDGLAKALELLNLGRSRQAIGSNALNDESSRSHAVYTMEVVRKFQSETKKSKLTFVDLAGSERIKKTQVEGVRKRESIQINVGLSALGNVINALADEKMIQRRSSVEASTGRPSSPDGYVPYRASKLTRLLRDALGGNSRTVFLACVSPLDSNSDETLSTLQYANRARNIQNKADRHIEHEPVPHPSPSEVEVARLQEEVARLKHQVAELTTTAREREDASALADQTRAAKKQQKKDARRDVEVTTEILITPHRDAETQADDRLPVNEVATSTDTDLVVMDQSDAGVQSGASFSQVADAEVGTVLVLMINQTTGMDAVVCVDSQTETEPIEAPPKTMTHDADTECDGVMTEDGSTETEQEPESRDAAVWTENECAQVDVSTECDVPSCQRVDECCGTESMVALDAATDTDSLTLIAEVTATCAAHVQIQGGLDSVHDKTETPALLSDQDEDVSALISSASGAASSDSPAGDQVSDTLCLEVELCTIDEPRSTATCDSPIDEKSDGVDPAVGDDVVANPPKMLQPTQSCDPIAIRPSLPVFSVLADDVAPPLHTYPTLKSVSPLPRIAKQSTPDIHDDASENQIEVDASDSVHEFVVGSASFDEEDELARRAALTSRQLCSVEFTTDSTESETDSVADPSELRVAPLPPAIIPIAVKTPETPVVHTVNVATAQELEHVVPTTLHEPSDFTVRRSRPNSTLKSTVSSPRVLPPSPPSVRPLRLFSFDDANPHKTAASTLTSGIRELVVDQFGCATMTLPPQSCSAVDQLIHETSTLLAQRRRRLQRIAKRRREIQTLEDALRVGQRAPISEAELQAYTEATQDQFLQSLLDQLTAFAAERLERRLRNRLQADASSTGTGDVDAGPFLAVDQCNACAEWFFHRPTDRELFTTHVLPLVMNGWIRVTEDDLEAEHAWLHL